jgi:alpha-1,6-mannosyltransferase
LYVGRLSNEKNTRTLFAAFEAVLQHRSDDAHLLVVGDGPEQTVVEQLRRRFPAHVTWIPYCSESSELARFYRAADLFVHPGVQETFGLVALEAQACGTPVVGIRGTNMDGVILHDQDDWATENTTEAVAIAIERAIAGDLSVRGEVAARRVHEQYAWARSFERLFCIYEAISANYMQTRRA